MAKILLADDDAALRRVIQFKLEKKGHSVTTTADGSEALVALRESEYDLVLSDMKMPGMTGIELLKQVKNLRPGTDVILITAFAAVSQAVEAMKLGAFDYLTKPFDDDQLFLTIDKALRFKQLEEENRSLRQKLVLQGVRPIAGVSRAYKEMEQLTDKVAPTDATVLLTGESGTGKEVVARTIHARSPRAQGSFIAVNCAAIPSELIESELFGHVRGAFTGAVKDKKGKFELADGGTLLLDEISELNIELQAKLLRAIQQKVIEPVGSEEKREVDIRLIAATNKNLKEKVAQGKFREDLFYRLNVIPITVPALRDRKDDIPVLASGFLAALDGTGNVSIDNALMATLMAHDWPGNIRELENLIERMVILRRSDTLTPADLPDDFTSVSRSESGDTAVEAVSDDISLHEAEKRLILKALRKSSGNKSQAAKQLKIPRHVLIYRMKKYGIFNHHA